MKLLLMRHGDKKDDNEEENDKHLSEIGKEKSNKTAFLIKNKLDKEKIDFILYSPAVHAKETAERVAHILGYPKDAKEVKEETSLFPGSNTNSIKVVINDPKYLLESKVILLIGHDPQITNLISDLSGTEVVLDRAGVCCIE